MTRIHIFCEGQTEETFVREVLQEHLIRHKIYPNPIVVRTSITSKGGLVRYDKLCWQIEHKCKEDKSAYVTSLIDLYALPKDFPNKADIDAQSDPFQKVKTAEEAFRSNINQRNFIPNLLLHEFEALLLSDITKFNDWFPADIVNGLLNDIGEPDSPEHVNDNRETAPSKRILRNCTGYSKPLHGSLIAMSIGLEKIRDKCKHFDTWLVQLEKLGT